MTLQKLEAWIDTLKTAIISSVDEDGFPNTKAMLPPRKHDGLQSFYFSTNLSSRRVAQYQQNPKACLYFFEKGRFKYQGAMFKGTMQVLTDAASKEMIWLPGDTMYYRRGVTDPDYCVLKFVVDTAYPVRFYSSLKNEDIPFEG